MIFGFWSCTFCFLCSQSTSPARWNLARSSSKLARSSHSEIFLHEWTNLRRSQPRCRQVSLYCRPIHNKNKILLFLWFGFIQVISFHYLATKATYRRSAGFSNLASTSAYLSCLWAIGNSPGEIISELFCLKAFWCLFLLHWILLVILQILGSLSAFSHRGGSGSHSSGWASIVCWRYFSKHLNLWRPMLT